MPRRCLFIDNGRGLQYDGLGKLMKMEAMVFRTTAELTRKVWKF